MEQMKYEKKSLKIHFFFLHNSYTNENYFHVVIHFVSFLDYKLYISYILAINIPTKKSLKIQFFFYIIHTRMRITFTVSFILFHFWITNCTLATF
jgi:hypothetical protein